MQSITFNRPLNQAIIAATSVDYICVAGTQTAYAWVRCGHRTLDDLRAVESSLTRNQRIGLKYYDEFLERMPRAEAAQIEATVELMLLVLAAVNGTASSARCGLFIGIFDMAWPMSVCLSVGCSHW